MHKGWSRIMPIERVLQLLKQHKDGLPLINQAAEKVELRKQSQLHKTVTPALTPSAWLRTGADETIPVPAEASRRSIR